MLKLLEEIREENLRIFGFGKDFLNKQKQSKKKFNKLIKLKLCSSKDSYENEKIKLQTRGKCL